MLHSENEVTTMVPPHTTIVLLLLTARYQIVVTILDTLHGQDLL